MPPPKDESSFARAGISPFHVPPCWLLKCSNTYFPGGGDRRGGEKGGGEIEEGSTGHWERGKMASRRERSTGSACESETAETEGMQHRGCRGSQKWAPPGSVMIRRVKRGDARVYEGLEICHSHGSRSPVGRFISPANRRI